MCATRPAAIADPIRLEVLYDRASSVVYDLPVGLWRRYGGDLNLRGRRIYANFVSSVDGVVALDMKHSPAVISQRSEADRFVMGLLRARADAVLIGGATLRADPGHLWTASYIYPDATADFRELRRKNGQTAEPRLVVLTASGQIDPSEAALEGALVVTTTAAEGNLRQTLPSTAEVRALARVTAPDLVRVLREERLELVLSEAGPEVFGQLVAAGCLNDLFLTSSPVLVGSAGGGRKTLSQGIALDEALSRMDLVSARRHGSHLLFRYALRPEGESSTQEGST
jgi:riboflavin biosynthesis pyrimidine reductase